MKLPFSVSRKLALISDFTVVGIGGVDTNATIIKNLDFDTG